MKMRKIRLTLGGWLLLGFGAVGVFAQTNSPYPQSAEGVVDFAETLFKTDFSDKEIIDRLGTINQTKAKKYFLLIEPYSSGSGIIEKIMVFVRDEDKKVSQVDFNFAKPIQISYGTLRKKFGLPKILPSPVINCDTPNCPRKFFVGYSVEQSRLIKNKKVGILIFLNMKMVSKFPKHNDQSILEVEGLSFRRIID